MSMHSWVCLRLATINYTHCSYFCNFIQSAGVIIIIFQAKLKPHPYKHLWILIYFRPHYNCFIRIIKLWGHVVHYSLLLIATWKLLNISESKCNLLWYYSVLLCQTPHFSLCSNCWLVIVMKVVSCGPWYLSAVNSQLAFHHSHWSTSLCLLYKPVPITNICRFCIGCWTIMV